jgi:uncharacterized protein YyaL (SSP411 family)
MPIVREEGKYYVWTAEELTAILGQEATYFLIIITVQKMEIGKTKRIFCLENLLINSNKIQNFIRNP